MFKKDPVINCAKGIAILLVVHGHVLQRHMVVAHEDFFSHPVFQAIYSFHMPLFVFISGYLFAGSLSRHALGQVFQSKVKGLLVPYFCWGILGVFTTLVLRMTDGKQGIGNVMNLVIDQLFITPAVWFLWTLFWISVLVLGAMMIAQKSGRWIHLVVCAAIWALPAHHFGSIYYIQWFYPFFIAGILADKLKDQRIMTYWKIGSILAFGLWLVLIPFWQRDDVIYIHQMMLSTTDDTIRLIYRYGMGFLGIAMTLGLARVLSLEAKAQWLGTLGLFSLDIYLIQRYVVEGLYPKLIARFGDSFDHGSLLFLGIFVPLMACLMAGICICISQITIRKIKIASTLLLGARD